MFQDTGSPGPPSLLLWSWGRLLHSFTQSLQEAWGSLLGCVGIPGGELLTSASHSWVTEMGRGHQLPSLASRRQIGWDKKGARHQTMQSKALGRKPWHTPVLSGLPKSSPKTQES